MSRHHPDLVMCRKQAGIAIGRLCDKCDGKCPVCDSYVRPTTLVRICDECSFGNYQNKCVVCGGEGISDAFYCHECTRLEKDRDGCPKIINLGSSRTDVSSSPALRSAPASLLPQWAAACRFRTFADFFDHSYSTKRKRIGHTSPRDARAWADFLHLSARAFRNTLGFLHLHLLKNLICTRLQLLGGGAWEEAMVSVEDTVVERTF